MSGSSSDTTDDQGQVDDKVVDTNTPEPSGQDTPDDKGTPSTPDPGEKPSMLDAVKAAIKPKADASPAPQTPDPKSKDAEPAKTDEPSSEEDDKEPPSDEEKKHWSPRTQRRFRKLNSQVNEQGQLISQLSPKAEEFDRQDTFVRNAGLSKEDVDGTLQIAAQLRNDPIAAYRALVPIMQHLERAVGNVLPPQLEERVAAGYLTREDALAYNRASTHADLATRQLQEREEANRVQAERQGQQEALDRSVQSVEAWQKQKATTDPDWHLKVDDVHDAVELAVLKQRSAKPGWIPTQDEALKITTDAYDEVTKRMRRFVPKPTPLARDTNGGGASPRSVAEPKNMLEAIRQAARR